MVNREELVEFIKKKHQTDGNEYGEKWLYHAWTLGAEIRDKFNLYEEFEKEFERNCSSITLPPLASEFLADKVIDLIRISKCSCHGDE